MSAGRFEQRVAGEPISIALATFGLLQLLPRGAELLPTWDCANRSRRFTSGAGYTEPAGERILFIDDRPENVAGAVGAGMQGIRFEGAESLRCEFSEIGRFVESGFVVSTHLRWGQSLAIRLAEVLRSPTQQVSELAAKSMAGGEPEMTTIEMKVSPETFPRSRRATRGIPEGGDSGDLWRFGRLTKRKLVPGSFIWKQAGLFAGGVFHCRRGAPAVGRQFAAEMRAGPSRVWRPWTGKRPKLDHFCQKISVTFRSFRRSGRLCRELNMNWTALRRKRTWRQAVRSIWPRRRSFLPRLSKTWAHREWRIRTGQGDGGDLKNPSAMTLSPARELEPPGERRL